MDGGEHVFFHFSEYRGDVHELRVGDEVEFVMGVDSRSRRDVAKGVVPMPRGTVQLDTVDEQELQGRVTRQARQGRQRSSGRNDDSSGGRIDYSTDAEPAGRITWQRQDQMDPHENIDVEDTVAFRIATDRRNNRQVVDEGPNKAF